MSKGHKESKQLLIRDLGKLKSESQGKSICGDTRSQIETCLYHQPYPIIFIPLVDQDCGGKKTLLEEDKFFSWCCLSEQNNPKAHQF